MKKTLLLIAFTIFSISIFSSEHKKDEFEIRYIKKAIHLNEDIQYHLRNDIKWQSFLQDNPNWFVYFNEFNRLPHRAFGEGISITSVDDFINYNLSFLKISVYLV